MTRNEIRPATSRAVLLAAKRRLRTIAAALDSDAQRLLLASLDVITSMSHDDVELHDGAWLSHVACAEPHLLERLEHVCASRDLTRLAALAVH